MFVTRSYSGGEKVASVIIIDELNIQNRGQNTTNEFKHFSFFLVKTVTHKIKVFINIYCN